MKKKIKIEAPKFETRQVKCMAKGCGQMCFERSDAPLVLCDRCKKLIKL